VTREREVGVDSEEIERGGRPVGDEMICRCLSAHELNCFRGLPPEQRQSSFFDYWTLKEAYVKARGVGLFAPVEEITFTWRGGVPHQGEVSVSFGPGIDDDPRTWQFAQLRPTTRHRLAVALRRPAGHSLSVVWKEFPRDLPS
jgi:4'-phosphopantetheinyl transferase